MKKGNTMVMPPHHFDEREKYLKFMRGEFELYFGGSLDMSRDSVGGYTNPHTVAVFSAFSTAHQQQQERVDFLKGVIQQVQKGHHPDKGKKPSKVRGKMVEQTCKCGNKFEARESDVRRGWGVYCSKSCAARYGLKR